MAKYKLMVSDESGSNISEESGLLYVEVVSDGTTGEEWIARLEREVSAEQVRQAAPALGGLRIDKRRDLSGCDHARHAFLGR